MPSLKDFAKSYTVPAGALKGVTLFLMPYRTVQTERVIMELNSIEPEVAYVHADGRRQATEPDDLKAERERVEQARQRLLTKAAALKVEPDARKLAALVVTSDWQRVYNWNVEHQAFWKYDSLVVHIDWTDIDEQSPAELRAFKRYMDTRSANTAERWQMFRAVLGTETANALYAAYLATRDVVGAAPPEMGQDTPPDDPLERSVGEASETTTTA